MKQEQRRLTCLGPIPWNPFLFPIFGVLRFWPTTGPQDYPDKAQPYMPAYHMKVKINHFVNSTTVVYIGQINRYHPMHINVFKDAHEKIVTFKENEYL